MKYYRSLQPGGFPFAFVYNEHVVEFISSRVNKTLVKLVAKLGGYMRLPLNSPGLDKLVENHVVENNKLIKALGCKLPVSARQGILKTIQPFKG